MKPETFKSGGAVWYEMYGGTDEFGNDMTVLMRGRIVDVDDDTAKIEVLEDGIAEWHRQMWIVPKAALVSREE